MIKVTKTDYAQMGTITVTVFDEDGDSGGIQFLKQELDMCLGIIAETKRYPD